MALRRASINLLKVLEVQNAGVVFRPAAACMQFTTSAPRSDSIAIPSNGRSAYDALDRNAYGRSFAKQLHSMNQAKNDDHETFEYESSKMRAEGGGTEEKSFQEKSAEVLKTKSSQALSGADDVKEKTEEVADTVKEGASEQAEKGKDVLKEVSETATGLKEVGVEAGKAVARDASKVAEKVGLKSES